MKNEETEAKEIKSLGELAAEDRKVLTSFRGRLLLMGPRHGAYVEQANSDHSFWVPSIDAGKDNEIVDIIIVSRPGRPILEYAAPNWRAEED